jgi:hypothetical protein
MFAKLQAEIAKDINAIGNPWAKYGAWAAYWLAHGLAFATTFVAKWSLKLTMGLAYALTVKKILEPAPKKKKKR